MTASTPRSLLKDSLWLAGAVALAIQWIVVHHLHLPLTTFWETVLPGLGIFGAAFLLSWGAELAQLEISQALALAFLALMAVLPEYAVDVYLAWQAANDPAYISYAAANMTGANRLLIGIGWPAVLFVFWARTRQREIVLEPDQRLALVTLLVATGYAFLIPLKRTLSLVDTVILTGLFAVYLVLAGRAHQEEPGLAGPPERLAYLARGWRRLVTILLFLVPGYTIFIAAEPFATGLIESARRLGIEEFLLIQWLAPLASESPEFVVAVLFAIRNNPQAGLGTLVSSKVNQWTLLIGMLPLAYAVSGAVHGLAVQPMHLDDRQTEEIALTAAQSLFAIVVLANFRFGFWEAVALCGLFVIQLVFPAPAIRTGCIAAYLLIVLACLTRKSYRATLIELLVRGWRAPAS